MPVKLSNILKDKPGDTGVAPAVREYEHRFSMAKGCAACPGRELRGVASSP